MSLRSWVADKIRDAVEWITDHVLAPFRQWVQEAIQNIIVALRIFRHNLKKKMAEWLENDWVFLLFVAAIVAAVFLVPKILAKIKEWVIVAYISTVVQNLKDGVGKLIDANKIIDLHLLHSILLVIWDDYKETFITFTDAVSQLSSELGEGSTYIHAYFVAAKAVMMGTNAIIGGDPLGVEIEWYGRVSDFFIEAEKNFARYARDPGEIYYDFMEQVMIPAAEEQRDANQEEINQIRENYNRTKEVETGMKTLRLGLDDLVEAMPGEIESQLRERWNPINEAWMEIEEIWSQQVMATIGAIIEAVEEHHREQMAINEAARLNNENAVRRSDLLMAMAEEDQKLMGDVFSHLIDLSQDEELKSLQDAATGYTSEMDRITTQYILDLFDLPALSFEDTGFMSRVPDRTVNIPSPFVGAY